MKVDVSSIYGELTAPSIVKIAKHIEKYKKRSFLDIGSGYGLVTRGINEYFRDKNINIKVTGIEKDIKRFNICNKINHTDKKYLEEYNIIHGNIFDHINLIKEAEYIFSNSICFGKQFPSKIINLMKPGTIFVHNTAGSENDENKNPLNLSCGWSDKNRFKIYVKE